MSPSRHFRILFTVVALVTCGCGSTPETGATSSHASLYPARPDVVASPPLADPPLQRPTVHLALSHVGLEQLLHALVPKEGNGAYALVGERHYTWQRTPFALQFDDAKKIVLAHADVDATVEVPGGDLAVKLAVDAEVQPVLSATHQLAMQAVRVKVTSDDRRVKLAEWGGGLVTAIEKALTQTLSQLTIDLAKPLGALYNKLQTPMFFPLGTANACFNLDVRGMEVGPSIFANGFEKQLALVVAPSITMPCTVRDDAGQPLVVTSTSTLPQHRPLPALHNASSIEGGPFALQVPMAAGYDEIEKAMAMAFAGGKLYFSTENPKLYLFDPKVFASDGALVASVKIGGRVEHGLSVDVDGEIFLVGHPQVRDNFLEVPDLVPTVETDRALLSIAAAVKQAELTAAVKKALRLDLSARLQSLKAKLVDALSVEVSLADGVAPMCTRAEVGRIEVSAAHAHDAYLRVYVETTATAAAYLPCPTKASPVARFP